MSSIHVHDLPQIYTKPSVSSLLNALNLLAKKPPSFDPKLEENAHVVQSEGVPRYLTNIIASSLDWLDEDARNEIWDLASVRLSERAGRTAAPSMTRTFAIEDDIVLALHEPSLTGDSLGLKTWTSSLLLAKRLSKLQSHLPRSDPRMLELGSGTGLVGLAAACVWANVLEEVLLTDLAEIVPNLARNVELNSGTLKQSGKVKVRTRTLDWTNVNDSPTTSTEAYPLIIAADPIYSPEHPKILVDTIRRWIKPGQDSRFILELPTREAYGSEREDLVSRLNEFMLMCDDGKEIGHDDWEDTDGELLQVECWWSVWKLK